MKVPFIEVDLVLCQCFTSIFSCVHCDKYGYNCIILHTTIQFDYLLNMLISLQCAFLVCQKLGVCKCRLTSGSLIQFHWSTCLSVCQHYAGFLTYHSPICPFEIREIVPLYGAFFNFFLQCFKVSTMQVFHLLRIIPRFCCCRCNGER